jgi:hypothetical protein
MECEGDEKRWEDSWCGVEVFLVVGAMGKQVGSCCGSRSDDGVG